MTIHIEPGLSPRPVFDPHQPFLTALDNDPTDLHRVAVYADWLDERGDGVEAECLRWAVRLGRRPRFNETCISSPIDTIGNFHHHIVRGWCWQATYRLMPWRDGYYVLPITLWEKFVYTVIKYNGHAVISQHSRPELLWPNGSNAWQMLIAAWVATAPSRRKQWLRIKPPFGQH